MGKRKLWRAHLLCLKMSHSGGELTDISLLRCLLCTQHLEVKHVSFPDCGHTFCDSCLLSHHQTQLKCAATTQVSSSYGLQNYGCVRCPVCGGEGVNGDRLGQVPFSHYIHTLLYGTKITPDKMGKDAEKKCSWCKQQYQQQKKVSKSAIGTARKQCYQCRALLCERCYTDHERQFGIGSGSAKSAEHIVVRTNTSRRRLHCRQHKEEIVYYCKQCKQLACERCVLDRRAHLDHDVLRLDKIQEHQLQKVNTHRQQINQIISHKYHRKKKKVPTATLR